MLILFLENPHEICAFLLLSEQGGEYKANYSHDRESGDNHTTRPAPMWARHLQTQTRYSRADPHLYLVHIFHSSTMPSRVLQVGEARPSNTHAFRSSQMARVVSMISELAIFSSFLLRLCTAAGHQIAIELLASGRGRATPSRTVIPAHTVAA